jgi:hypothetical protein
MLSYTIIANYIWQCRNPDFTVTILCSQNDINYSYGTDTIQSGAFTIPQRFTDTFSRHQADFQPAQGAGFQTTQRRR